LDGGEAPVLEQWLLSLMLGHVSRVLGEVIACKRTGQQATSEQLDQVPSTAAISIAVCMLVKKPQASCQEAMGKWWRSYRQAVASMQEQEIRCWN
jgi:predicted metal-binding protein